MPDYQKLQKKIVDFRNRRSWKQYHPPKNMVISLWVEVGELAEHFQYLDDEKILLRLAKRRKQVADELVDVLWWLLLIAHDWELDISKEFSRKMKKNMKKDVKKKYKEVKLKVPSKIDSLSEMSALVREFRKLRGWDKDSHPRDLLLKMFEEVGELAEFVQWKSGDELLAHIEKHKKQIADELVDVLICTLLLFNSLGYDIEAEFERKTKNNANKYPLT